MATQEDKQKINDIKKQRELEYKRELMNYKNYHAELRGKLKDLEKEKNQVDSAINNAKGKKSDKCTVLSRIQRELSLTQPGKVPTNMGNTAPQRSLCTSAPSRA